MKEKLISKIIQKRKSKYKQEIMIETKPGFVLNTTANN